MTTQTVPSSCILHWNSGQAIVINPAADSYYENISVDQDKKTARIYLFLLFFFIRNIFPTIHIYSQLALLDFLYPISSVKFLIPTRPSHLSFALLRSNMPSENENITMFQFFEWYSPAGNKHKTI